jgi:hypothetical protein
LRDSALRLLLVRLPEESLVSQRMAPSRMVTYMHKLVSQRLSLMAAFVMVMTGAHAAPDDNPSGDPNTNGLCSRLGVYIFVGGTGGFNALRDGDQFKPLLNAGHVGLYQHANAISAAEKSAGLVESIEDVFAGTGAGEAELGQVGWNYFTLPPSYGYYQEQYILHGLSPSEANVNTPSDSAAPGQLEHDLEQWKEYVVAARSVGIKSVAPVVAPNAADEPKLGENVFATNPYYELERDEALYGKAIAFDVPPNFFLSDGSGPGYRKFIIQAIQWGNARGLRTTMLLSPYPWPTDAAGRLETFRQFTGNTFSRDTRIFVSILEKEKAVPSEWAVDNYEDTYPNDAPAMVPDTVRNTTTEVGLWLARHAPVYVHGEDTEGVICRPQPLVDTGNSDLE